MLFVIYIHNVEGGTRYVFPDLLRMRKRSVMDIKFYDDRFIFQAYQSMGI